MGLHQISRGEQRKMNAKKELHQRQAAGEERRACREAEGLKKARLKQRGGQGLLRRLPAGLPLTERGMVLL